MDEGSSSSGSEEEEEVREEDTLTVLVMTDNHVGFLERDTVRGEDSFNTLEEILQIARREKVLRAGRGRWKRLLPGLSNWRVTPL